MKNKFENGVLTVFLEGRIDTGNAEQVGAEIDAILGTCPDLAACEVVLDAENLAYISSAGLRVVLKLRRRVPSTRIVNANAEVYDIFEMTGFTEMMPVEKAFRKLSVEGCPVIGKGAKGTVYRYNEDTIVKVYHNPDSLPVIKKEREFARRAFVLGIPTAISYDVVKVGESYGSVFELLDAKSYSQLIKEDPDGRDRYIAEYATLLRRIHETPVKPEDMPDIKPAVFGWLRTAAPFLSPEDAEKLWAMIDAVPDVSTMLHCDYHTNNVMSQKGETLLIDMDTLSRGHPIFELANVYITYVGFGERDPEMVARFLGMPYEAAVEIWQKFLPAYLGTPNAAKIADVEKKASLLANVRRIRHIARRDTANDPRNAALLDYCRERVHALLAEVNTLDFEF